MEDNIYKLERENKLKSRIIILSILSNFLLVVVKLFAGYITGLVSVTAEALHSANDMLASVIAYFGVNKSLKPPDKDHQYGHGKMETITGWIENFLILIIGITIVYNGVQKLINKHPHKIIEAGIVVMIFSGTVNFFISRYLIKKGRELRSIGIEIDGEHLRADVLTSFGTVFALLILKITGLWWIDPLTAIIIGLWVIGIFISLSIKLTQQIMDKGLSKEEIEMINEIVRNFKEVKSFHKLRTRQSGSTIFIDMHIKVDKKMNVQKSHQITKEIEKLIKEKFINSNILIHIEPFIE